MKKAIVLAIVVVMSLSCQSTKGSMVSDASLFRAQDHITSANVGVMGRNFLRLYFGKEEVVSETTNFHTSNQSNIVGALGNKIEIKLSDLFGLIEKQSRGQHGILLVNGRANVTLVRGLDGNTMAVCAFWSSMGHCWDIGAVPKDRPNSYFEGGQVVFCYN
ncbi:MAG: hypothetical protein NT094_03010 [Candidatus Staskawiczbacteria bacterium]|nr:hypothetical protein [Candidatus Staskawiczbacteria bacterium]